jgi:hypothetical protein
MIRKQRETHTTIAVLNLNGMSEVRDASKTRNENAVHAVS